MASTPLSPSKQPTPIDNDVVKVIFALFLVGTLVEIVARIDESAGWALAILLVIGILVVDWTQYTGKINQAANAL